MKELYFYKCESCEEVHDKRDNISKCKICGREICIECSVNEECFDYCEPRTPYLIIRDFIKENRYTYSVECILEEYKTKWGKSYTSYTMTHCIESLKKELDALIKE